MARKMNNAKIAIRYLSSLTAFDAAQNIRQIISRLKIQNLVIKFMMGPADSCL